MSNAIEEKKVLVGLSLLIDFDSLSIYYLWYQNNLVSVGFGQSM